MSAKGEDRMTDPTRKDLETSEPPAHAETPVARERAYRGPRLAKYGPLREIVRAKPGRRRDGGFRTQEVASGLVANWLVHRGR